SPLSNEESPVIEQSETTETDDQATITTQNLPTERENKQTAVHAIAVTAVILGSCTAVAVGTSATMGTSCIDLVSKLLNTIKKLLSR
ncbi:MAG: hypothetical protein RR205_02280, partial [Oscillospiraceae bacterium]